MQPISPYKISRQYRGCAHASLSPVSTQLFSSFGFGDGGAPSSAWSSIGCSAGCWSRSPSLGWGIGSKFGIEVGGRVCIARCSRRYAWWTSWRKYRKARELRCIIATIVNVARATPSERKKWCRNCEQCGENICTHMKATDHSVSATSSSILPKRATLK